MNQISCDSCKGCRNKWHNFSKKKMDIHHIDRLRLWDPSECVGPLVRCWPSGMQLGRPTRPRPTTTTKQTALSLLARSYVFHFVPRASVRPSVQAASRWAKRPSWRQEYLTASPSHVNTLSSKKDTETRRTHLSFSFLLVGAAGMQLKVKLSNLGISNQTHCVCVGPPIRPWIVNGPSPLLSSLAAIVLDSSALCCRHKVGGDSIGTIEP